MFPPMSLVMLQPSFLLLLLGIELRRVLILDLLLALLALFMLLWGLAFELTRHPRNSSPGESGYQPTKYIPD